MATETMRATVFEEPGGPSALREVELPRPVPGSGEMLVQVRACGVNGFDLMARSGEYRTGQQPPHILGGDVVGTVAAYGPDCAETVPVGANVALHWVISCGRCEQCLRGYETTCLKYGYLGAKFPGGYAQYVVVPERNAYPLGGFSDLNAAASVPMAFGTAWHMLVTRANLRPGETVLVQAVGSGIGAAACQIARLLGAHVIGTAGSDWKLAKAREMGVTELVNYQDADLRQEVLRRTGKRGVDVVFEHVGGELFDAAVGCLTRNGRLVTCGGTAGYQVSMNVAQVFHKQLTIIGSNSATRWEFGEVMRIVLDGGLTPVVDEVYPLEKADRAHEHLEDRRGFGKVVLSVDH